MTIVTGTPEFQHAAAVHRRLHRLLRHRRALRRSCSPRSRSTSRCTDTYFVVAHFHYVIFGAAVFPILGGIYYWFPKVTGRMYHERLGQASFWLIFSGTNVTFFPMHIVGLLGMPRRVYTYPRGARLGRPNLVETLGAYFLAGGLVLIVGNLVVSRFRGPPAGPDPWRRRHARVGDHARRRRAYNFAVIPTGHEPLRDVGRARTARRRARARAGRAASSRAATRRRPPPRSTPTWTRCSRCRRTRPGR